MKSAKWMFLFGALFLAFLTSCGGGSTCNGTLTYVGGGNKNGFVCNGSGAPPPPAIAPVYVYTVDSGNKIHASALTDGTTFAELTSLTLPTLAIQSYDMLVVSKKFLYVSGINGSNGEVFGYTIDSATGGLTAITGNPVLTGTQAGFSMATDPLGRFLYVGDAAGDVAAFTIDASTGVLTATSNSPFQLDPNTGLGISFSLAVDNSGKYLYVGQGPNARNGLIADVFGFTIDQNTGDLTPIVGGPFVIGVGLIDVSPTLPNIVGTSATTGDNHIYSITVGQGGLLAPIVSSNTLATPNQVVAHPGGKYVYALENGTFTGDTLEIFSMDSGGNLNLVNGSPFTSAESLRTCKIDQNGNWMFCDTSVSKVAVFGIDSGTGAVTSTIPSITAGNALLLAVTD